MKLRAESEYDTQLFPCIVTTLVMHSHHPHPLHSHSTESLAHFASCTYQVYVDSQTVLMLSSRPMHILFCQCYDDILPMQKCFWHLTSLPMLAPDKFNPQACNHAAHATLPVVVLLLSTSLNSLCQGSSLLYSTLHIVVQG